MANKIILTGNTCGEIELRKTQSGNLVGNVNIAVRRTRKNQNGEYDTDFFRLTMFGKQAEFAEQYIKKGSKVYVEGNVQTGKYENKQGQEVPTFDVYVETIENLTPREKSNSEPKNGDSFDKSNMANTLNITEEDLPF